MESKKNTPYKDGKADDNLMWSVGYGHSLKPDFQKGELVLSTRTIQLPKEGYKNKEDAKKFGQLTDAEAKELLERDLGNRKPEIISQLGGKENWAKLDQGQQAAIQSYYYNTGKLPGGKGEFKAAVASGDREKVASMLESGIKTYQGKENKGLVERRGIEGQLAREGLGGSAGAMTKVAMGEQLRGPGPGGATMVAMVPGGGGASQPNVNNSQNVSTTNLNSSVGIPLNTRSQEPVLGRINDVTLAFTG